MRMIARKMAAASLFLFPVVALAVEEEIASHCAEEWPADFAMQEFCAKQQIKGYGQFTATANALEPDSPLRPAADKCLSDWSSDHGHDWAMVNFCYEQQVKAFERINQR